MPMRDGVLVLSGEVKVIEIEPRRWCQCEHSSHFDDEAEDGKHSHPYGDAPHGAEIVTIKTLYGTFDVCKGCSETCHGGR